MMMVNDDEGGELARGGVIVLAQCVPYCVLRPGLWGDHDKRKSEPRERKL